MYNGPDSHVITYPVAMGAFLNVLVVVSDPGEWATDDGRHTAKTTKKEMVQLFRGWRCPAVKALVGLLPEELDKWAIFDTLDHPAPRYNDGCVCVAGDAAHAAGPHLGAGAGFGIEDALVLATAIDRVNKTVCDAGITGGERVNMCSKALSVYNRVRYERTQWLVGATREACSLFQACRASGSAENEVFGEGISRLFLEIWDYDVDRMVKETVSSLEDTEITHETELPWLVGSV